MSDKLDLESQETNQGDAAIATKLHINLILSEKLCMDIN